LRALLVWGGLLLAGGSCLYPVRGVEVKDPHRAQTQAGLGLSLRVRVKGKISDIVANDVVSFCVVKVNDNGEARSALSHR
jgi:hypothetical protein